MIYFVFTAYSPNNAPINRVLSFVNGFSQIGVDVEMVFVLSDANGSKIDKEWPHVNVTYLWEKLDIRNRYLRQFSYTLLSRRFVKRLKYGDTVVLFDAQRMIFTLLKKKGIKIYAEKTEHPFAYAVRTIDMNKYVEACKRIDGLFVISTALKEYFCSKGVAEEKVHIINMTVNPSRFDGLTKQEVTHPYIAYCGTASNNKDGVDELIKSFAIVSEKYPQYQLYIIGKGITKNEDSGNLRLVESLGLKEKVVFTGIVSSEKMPQMLKNAQILALDRPDNLQAKYGFPTKLGEYLLTENPVVVTRVGDIPLFLKDGDSVYISEPQNSQAFASKLMWVIEHPKEAEKVGKKGAEVARTHFNGLIESKKIARIIGCIKLK